MMPFSNWAGTHSCHPSEVVFPANEDDLVGLVRQARARRRRIKVVGAAHSWSDIAMTDDILVSLDHMAGILRVRPDEGLARVQAGIRLQDLTRGLAAHGMGLTILGSVAVQSLAGVLATGTHGGSERHGNLASFVTGMRVVTGRGEVLELGPGDPRLPALRVGLGLGAIVTEVTLRIEPVFNLRETTFSLPFDTAMARMDEVVGAHEYAKLWWLPHTGRVQVFAYDRWGGPAPARRVARWLDAHMVNGVLFPALLGLGGRMPSAIPSLNRIIAGAMFGEGQRVGPSEHMFTLAMPPRHRETEWALPRERAVEATMRLREMVQSRDMKVNFIQEIRHVRADDAWMSPAHGRHTCQIGAFIGPSPSADAYLDGAQEIFRALDGRPHWGKELAVTPAAVRALYPRGADFVNLVRELDPDGVFHNRFSARVLGLGWGP